jgi:bifunctional non-homologous end joining protein LigD
MKKRTQLEVEGRSLEVSNLDKVLYPKAGFTKGQVIDYYIKISPHLLPHLHDRPITLKRYPDGVEGFFFYEKNCPAHRPKWMKTTNVVKTDGSIDYCVINELPALVWTANLADLELHTFLHRAPKIDRPTALAFDLDPGEPANIIDCCQIALRVKDLFGKLKLECFPKTSGSKGMQVYVPLNTPATYEQTKEFARQVAQTLERETPDLVVSLMAKNLRKGKIFVDWSQNDEHKTTINVYSLRAKDFPTVSTPLTWKEVATVARTKQSAPITFQPAEVILRVKKLGDLFAPVLELKQKLPRFPSTA